MQTISVYIHLPWCIKKCPYCDFNSHTIKDQVPESEYIEQLILDFNHEKHLINNRIVSTIFIGGGTPSFFKAKNIAKIINHIKNSVATTNDLEVTIEANPGVIDNDEISQYPFIGINRISLGVQSFNPDNLKKLGRVHSVEDIENAINIIKSSDYNSFNLDLMYALPKQTITDAINDLNIAISKKPQHLSWYQLTIEPNTVFYKTRPSLPQEAEIIAIEQQGHQLLQQKKYNRYEISAYSLNNFQCQHNLNYWRYGDYLGIGAGAHSKLTNDNQITRWQKVRQPNLYMQPDKPKACNLTIISAQDAIFEFMLNNLRLYEKIPMERFTSTTKLPINMLTEQLTQAINANFIIQQQNSIITTKLGKQFLNNLTEMFLR